ncbi:MAG: S16 family serine protease [Candidatus Parabeggiatoa sp.]|nr:S16 family serine protease [Candidatus Parabeggiatoa sp.]
MFAHNKKVDKIEMEVENLIKNDEFIEAVKFIREELLKLDKLDNPKSFQNSLFGTKMIFLKALRQAVAHKKKLWLGQFLSDENQSLSEQVPNSFTKIKSHPDWCQDACQSLVKTQIICAKEAIDYSEINPEGWKKLADQTGFPVGFVYELFFWLKEQEEVPVEKLEIPVLIQKFGTDGQAAYLVIERIKRDISSPPYPHPIKMANIPIKEDFKKAIIQAFTYVKHVLISEHREIPTFRWWVKLTPEEHERKEGNKILALEGPSFYGAFAVGMLSLARQLNLYPQTAITSDGDEYGQLSGVGGLEQKCKAAKRQGWKNIIIAISQDTQGHNDISNIPQVLLLRVETIKEALKYITSGIGFEVIDYLELVHERWGQLSLTEVPQDTREKEVDQIDFDKLTKPMTVRYIKGLNQSTEKAHDWNEAFSTQRLRRAVIYGWEKVGKTRLLRHEGRKISQENVDKLKKGTLDLEQITLPIFIECADLAIQLKGETSFEEALFATLKAEYQINGQSLSDDFVALIKEKFVNGNCVLLLDDFRRDKRRDKKKVQTHLIEKLNQFARNYPQCRIIITAQQEAKNKKDEYADLPLEISAQSDEAILELLSPWSNDCPYKGLQFFDFNDEDPKYFCGRQRLTMKLLKKLKNSSFLAVLGNSGSGKSSVLRAGLLHQLKLGERLPGSERWKILSPITPAWQNQKPLENLARVFVQPGLSAVDYATEFQKAYQLMAETGADGLKRLIDAIDTPRVVLVIDQFEEIFTLCDKTEQQSFFDCLLDALAHSKLCLVIVIRADFHGKWADYPELSRHIDNHSLTVTKMTSYQLEQAIIKPAEKVGLGIEQDLVRRILKDMKNSPGNLPLLQFALEQLCQKKKVNWLTLAEYDKMGGVEGALKNYADDIYRSLSPEEQATAQWIFQGVTQLGEAVDTRKPIAKQDLITPKYTEELVERTLDKLIKARLVVLSNPNPALTDKVTHERPMNP